MEICEKRKALNFPAFLRAFLSNEYIKARSVYSLALTALTALTAMTDVKVAKYKIKSVCKSK